MQPTNRTHNRSALTMLLRAVGLVDDAMSASVTNASRRGPQTRAALQRLQVRTNSDLARPRAWAPPIVNLRHSEA